MMLYIMLAYLMLFTALSNAVCIMLFPTLTFKMLIVFVPRLGLLTHSLFISSIISHHAQCL